MSVHGPKAMTQSHTLPRIAFVGPIAEFGKPARGGFEAANRRTIDLLRNQGVEVIEYRYPVVEGSLLRKSAAYGVRFTEIATKLIQSRGAWDILHITPLLRQFISAETLICEIPKKLARPLFLDLRAGNLIKVYKKRGKLYQRTLSRLIGNADVLAVEGKEYIDFARPWSKGQIFYFPNYVTWKNAFEPIKKASPEEAGELRLITLGRIVPRKGIGLAIELLKLFLESGIKANLDIIGSGETAYVEKLKTICRSLPVNFTGALPPGEIVRRLSERHFFIFATTHRGEGHSNALTEAMALGVVPVCSNNGFNSDVVGDAGLILPEGSSAQDYLDAISRILSRGNGWEMLSHQARRRVLLNFSNQIVLPKLIEEYQTAFLKQNLSQCANA